MTDKERERLYNILFAHAQWCEQRHAEALVKLSNIARISQKIVADAKVDESSWCDGCFCCFVDGDLIAELRDAL